MAPATPTALSLSSQLSQPVLLALSAVAALISLLFLALSVGPVPLPLTDVWAALIGGSENRLAEVTVWNLRLPRTLMAALVGASLGLAGAAMQGVLRNPLAEPGLAGVSSGAALGAAMVLTLNLPLQPQGFWLPVLAFVGAAVATVTVVSLANAGNQQDNHFGQTAARVLLAGIALNAFATALLGLASYWADDVGLRALTFWTLGSVARADWLRISIMAAAFFVPAIWLIKNAKTFNALMLGEVEAGYLGVPVRRFQWLVLMAVATMVGVATAFCGMIAFVGLVAPHLVRLVLGANYQNVLIFSPVIGALLLLFADMAARVIVAPAELPIGIVTALIGTPFFVWLQLKRA